MKYIFHKQLLKEVINNTVCNDKNKVAKKIDRI